MDKLKEKVLGKYDKQVTLLYGGEQTGKTSLVLQAVNYATTKEKKVLYFNWRSKPSQSFLSQFLDPGNVFFFKPDDYESLKRKLEMLISNNKIEWGLAVFHSISDIYRLEHSTKNGLSDCLDLIEDLSKNVPVIVVSEMYLDFDVDDLKLPAANCLKYFSKTVIKTVRMKGELMASMEKPNRKSCSFKTISGGVATTGFE